MKIAVFHNLPPGGAKRVVYEQVSRLAKKHQVDLFELSTASENFLDLTKRASKVNKYKFNPESKLPFFLARLEKDFKNFLVLANLHKKIAHDIDRGGYEAVLVHPDKFTQAPFLLRYLKTPSLYYCYELLRLAYELEFRFAQKVIFWKKWYEEGTRKIRKRIDRENAKAAKIILTDSKFTRNNIRKAYDREAAVCYPGVNTKVFKPTSSFKKENILFIGGKEKVNGFDLVRKALELIPGSYRSKLRVISFSLKGPRLSDKELAKEYSQALITVCVSLNEPFGLVPLESMACETPVIAVNEGGYRETVRDGVTGFLIKRKPQELVNKIIQLMKNPEEISRLGKQGRAHVLKNWTWETHIKILEGEIKKLVKR